MTEGKKEYAHMCRMDHVQIGHNESEHEECPLCRANSECQEQSRLLGMSGERELKHLGQIAMFTREVESLRSLAGRMATELSGLSARMDQRDGEVHFPVTCGKLGYSLCSVCQALSDFARLTNG